MVPVEAQKGEKLGALVMRGEVHEGETEEGGVKDGAG